MTASLPGNGRARLPALTGVRIFAALAVYVNHIGAPEGAPEALTNFMNSGYSGVTIFFVLSGFVLTINYFKQMRHPTSTGVYDYFVARFARVYPLYVLVLLFVVIWQHYDGEGIDGWWRHVLAVQAWDPNVLRAFDFNGPGWSISVEFFLYACFPLLIPLVARLRRPPAMLLTIAAIAVAMLALTAWFALTRADLPIADSGAAHRWLYRTPLTRLGDFALGILVARIYMTGGVGGAAARIGRPLTWASILAIVALMSWPAFFISAWSWDVGYALPAAALLFGLAVAPATLPARFLSLPLVVLLGEASYAFYLVHFPGLEILGGGRWMTEFSAVTVIQEALTLAVLLGLAVALHFAFEKPVRTYLRQKLSRPRPARPS